MKTIIDTPFVISPPFGNYVSAPQCTRIVGSFTWEPRPGLWRQMIRSLRPTKGGWVNQIGLRNCGIRNVRIDPRHVYSVVGLNDAEWQSILDFLPAGLRVEVNLGCPNVHRYGIEAEVLAAYCAKFQVIAKLPPTASDAMIRMCVEAGVRCLHLCNTLPSPRGGISGTALRPRVEEMCYYVSRHHPDIAIIAGGGIYGPHDIEVYALAGARHFSLSTIWFRPWRVPLVLMRSKYLPV